MIATRRSGVASGAGTVRLRRRPPAIAVLRRLAPALFAVAAVAGVVLVVDPRSVAVAVSRFDRRAAAPLLALTVAFYALQGLRWHLLLRHVGVRQRVVDSEVINLAGQAVNAFVPLGDLTRALLVSRSSGVGFGATAATVTVQELSFTLVVVLAAAPALVALPGGAVWMTAVVAGVLGVVALLTVPALYAAVRRAVRTLPGLRRLATQVDELQREVRTMLVRPAVLAGVALDVARAAVAVAMLWLILHALGAHLGVTDAALVFAVSYVGGALSLLPGGIGANEASVVGILAVLGVSPAAAAAAAILQRLVLFGVAGGGGLVAWAVLRQRAGGAGRASGRIEEALAA